MADEMTLAQIDSELRVISRNRENEDYPVAMGQAEERVFTCAGRACQMSEDVTSRFPENTDFGTFLLQKKEGLHTEPPENVIFS